MKWQFKSKPLSFSYSLPTLFNSYSLFKFITIHFFCFSEVRMLLWGVRCVVCDGGRVVEDDGGRGRVHYGVCGTRENGEDCQIFWSWKSNILNCQVGKFTFSGRMLFYKRNDHLTPSYSSALLSWNFPISPSIRRVSVGWSVFLKGLEVFLPCSYRIF